MIKNILSLGCCLLVTALGLSQDLYQPRDINQAYKNNTRTIDGKPGKNYWQNKAIYNIKLQVAPPDRTVRGEEEITYINKSPDTLKSLIFKLYLNNHKPGAARLHQVGEDYLTSGTHIDNYLENGVKREWKDKNDGTNKRIKIAEPLAPNDSIHLTINWHFKVSKQSGREGAIDSTTFFLAYFYPRVAVYDDYSGWDTMTFTGSQEFYNDFNDYNFEITVPQDYLVWATGDLLNPEEVLQEKYARLLEKSMTSDSIMQIVSPEDLEKGNITASKDSLTWKWKAKNITDVAIALSDHYNWDASSVVVDNETGRRASVQAAYDDQSKDFHQMVEYGKHALDWFSNNYPGVPYPFQKSTIVRGFADMEYPMMVNDSSVDDFDFARFVVEHEIAHTYFPFYMGINETRFGFMDEGWATTFEHLIGTADLGAERAIKDFKSFRVNYWINDSSMEEDLPIITPSNILSGAALGNNEYGKAALGYLALKDLLGDKEFKKALQGYMDRWHGKHPVPWDFFYSVNDISGKDLNWFWNSWYFSNNYIDLGIKDVEVSNDDVKISLMNYGGMPAPVDVVIELKDGGTKTFHQSPGIWKEDPETALIKIDDIENINTVHLEHGIFMDADLSNDTFEIE